jgi:hypothetical protein
VHAFGTLPHTVAWTPKILSEFEIGQVMTAIETVGRIGKPLAHVGSRIGAEPDLRADLEACLVDAGETGRVSIWMERQGARVNYGFYGQPWVLRALTFLQTPDLQPQDRHWINGLLFGYDAAAIQRFAEANGVADERIRTLLFPNRTSDTPETALPPEARARLGS